MSFDDDTALRPLGDGAFEGEIVETWWTPLGPLGGFVMALTLRGLMLAVDDELRPPRSLTMHFLRPPKAGPIVVAPRIERTGRSLTTASARLEQDGAAVASRSRPSPRRGRARCSPTRRLQRSTGPPSATRPPSGSRVRRRRPSASTSACSGASASRLSAAPTTP